jgi:hypothetical protein
MHAEDDWIIPSSRSIQLHKIAKSKRKKTLPPVELKIVEKETELGHIFLYLYSDFAKIVKFVNVII